MRPPLYSATVVLLEWSRLPSHCLTERPLPHIIPTLNSHGPVHCASEDGTDAPSWRSCCSQQGRIAPTNKPQVCSRKARSGRPRPDPIVLIDPLHHPVGRGSGCQADEPTGTTPATLVALDLGPAGGIVRLPARSRNKSNRASTIVNLSTQVGSSSMTRR